MMNLGYNVINSTTLCKLLQNYSQFPCGMCTDHVLHSM